MNPLSEEELIQLRDLTLEMIKYAKESNWEETMRLDQARRSVLEYGTGLQGSASQSEAKAAAPFYVADPRRWPIGIADGQKQPSSSYAYIKDSRDRSARSSTVASQRLDHHNGDSNSEMQALIDEISSLDAELLEIATAIRSGMIKTNQKLSSQREAQLGYAKTESIT